MTSRLTPLPFAARTCALALAAALMTGCATLEAPASAPAAPAGATPVPAAPAAGTARAAAAPAVPTAPAAAAATPAGGARPAGPPAAAAATGAPPAAVRPGEPAPLRPFAEVIKDAKETKGFLPVWQKDERVWLEIPESLVGTPMFFGNSLASGLGERFFWPGLMGGEQIIVFRRVGNNVQLVARNMKVRAPAGTPLATAVAESYSDSLLAAAPVLSASHPERKSFLVDAAALLGGDLVGSQTLLETTYRLPYALDRANSFVERARATDEGTFITVRQHFAIPKLPAPPAVAPPPGTPTPTTPAALPDGRSLFLTFTHTLAPLPKEPMRPRPADQRVGHFTTAFWDFGNSTKGDARTHYVERWRLEKKDPAAEVSEPKQPILVWMDKNIPEEHRAAVRDGIVEWNKAFERAGFRNAVEVRQQPADADWSTLEGTRHIAVRWFALQGPGATAVGPSQSDPRTGEILRGAAIIPENWVRLSNAFLTDQQPRLAAGVGGLAGFNAAPPSLDALLGQDQCVYAFNALEQTAFALELLAARGDIAPGSPEARRFVYGSLKDVVMHEVGHALGLRHNFRASTGIKFEQLRDAAFTAQRGVSNSVMDYNARNIPLAGEQVADYNQTTLGRYDYWAIEYAYRELPAEQEAAELARIAARSATDPDLAYATDEDVIPQLGGGIDPRVNQFDLGDDPIAYYKRSFALARELWARTQKRELSEGDTYAVYRRNLQRGLGQFGAAVSPLSKYVGGVYTSRQLAGPLAPVLMTPVPAAQQREALGLLTRELFSSDSFRFEPAFMSRLGLDHLERLDRIDRSAPGSTDFSLATAVLTLQRTALDQLMSDTVAARLADAETKVADRRSLMTLAEVQDRLHEAIWSELKTGRNIDSLRRNLQRDHARRLAAGLVRPATPVAADVRAVNRQSAVRLRRELQQAMGRGTDAITRAHLAETLAMLDEALKASLVKSL
jgi:hypothetical protein